MTQRVTLLWNEEEFSLAAQAGIMLYARKTKNEIPKRCIAARTEHREPEK